MKKWHKWREVIQYKIDNLFSGGTPVTLLWLGINSLIIVLFASLLIVLLRLSPEDTANSSFFDIFWFTAMHAINPGDVDFHTSWGYRAVMFLITIVSLFFTSTFIGLISAGLNQYIEVLQRGRSKVVEKDHIVILGWNGQVFTIIEELVRANSGEMDQCIVVMGNHDKKEMEQLIHEDVPDLKRTRIVVRSGNPIVPNSLDILNLSRAKAIIVLSPDQNDPDSEVIKICLAITKQPDFEDGDCHVIAEMRDPKNIGVVNVLGRGRIQWILTGEIIAKITAQTSRQSGLSLVYTDLLDFAGDEIHFYKADQLVGRTFGDCLNLFEKNAVMGVVPLDETPILNPSMSRIHQQGDAIFLLAEDDEQIFPNYERIPPINLDMVKGGRNSQQAPEYFLIIGWNWRTSMVLKELDYYATPESEVTIFCDQTLMGEMVDFHQFRFNNLTLHTKLGDTTDRRQLDEITCHRYSHVLLVCYSNSLSPQAADAKSLITLLHLRDIIGMDEKCHFSITTEMMDTKDRDLAEVTKPDDFVIGSKIISLLFSQIAERKERNLIFTDIFNQEGSEIYLKPAGRYVSLDKPVNFYTVVESARQNGEVAIGYRKDMFHERVDKNFGVVINPNKSEELQLDKLDKIIVLSEN